MTYLWLYCRNHQRIWPESAIMTDGWAGYNGLSDLEGMYTHHVAIHEKEFVNADGKHTNRIESSMWGYFKRKYCSVRNKRRNLFNSYICEWIFRREHGPHILNSLVSTIGEIYKVWRVLFCMCFIPSFLSSLKFLFFRAIHRDSVIFWVNSLSDLTADDYLSKFIKTRIRRSYSEPLDVFSPSRSIFCLKTMYSN